MILLPETRYWPTTLLPPLRLTWPVPSDAVGDGATLTNVSGLYVLEGPWLPLIIFFKMSTSMVAITTNSITTGRLRDGTRVQAEDCHTSQARDWSERSRESVGHKCGEVIGDGWAWGGEALEADLVLSNKDSGDRGVSTVCAT
jgi:hypothetical protein